MKYYKHYQLRFVAESPALLKKYMIEVSRHFKLDDASASGNEHLRIIAALLKNIGDSRRMMIRMIQVQREQINKYWKSIHTERKLIKRGAPPSLDALTTELMVKMALRFIQDLKDAIPDLIGPLVSRIHNNLRKLQDRALLFTQSQRLAL